jgi:hypothetical protein
LQENYRTLELNKIIISWTFLLGFVKDPVRSCLWYPHSFLSSMVKGLLSSSVPKDSTERREETVTLSYTYFGGGREMDQWVSQRKG